MTTAAPTTARSLRYTPFRDLVRGRVTGRLDWRGRIAASGLPVQARDLITLVVRKTRLWRLEKAAVADELIGHFADGLAGGASADDLVRAFGDPRAAARLIRRATIRKRPLAWHGLKWLRRVVGVLLLLYAIVLARFVLSRPSVSVDYVARLNAPILATPEADRGWPLYRQALLKLMVPDKNGALVFDESIEGWIPDPNDPDGHQRTVLEARPEDGDSWQTLASWLDAHGDGLGLLRQAGLRPAAGFVLGPGGSQNDPALGWRFNQSVGPNRTIIEQSLISVLLPNLNSVRECAKVLAADARLARSRGDGARAATDYAAMLGVAAQQREVPLVINGLVGIGVANLAFEEIGRGLADDGLKTLDDAQLVGLAHRVATYGGETASSLIDLEGERMMFHDIVQRTYSDDGHGDGRITAEGARSLPMVMGTAGGSGGENGQFAAAVAITGVTMPLSSRRDLLVEYDRLLDLQVAAMARPLRDPPPGPRPDVQIERRIAEIKSSPLLLARYLPLAILMPSLNRVGWSAERVLGRRDGVVVGLALELYRRHNGHYPASLDELVPAMLPRVPVDRITGAPVRYRVVDGAPVVYSVGVDRDDDGGRPAVGRDKKPDDTLAAEWVSSESTGPRRDGDWILFDGRAKR